MAIERSPDFELCVARSEEGEHRAMLNSPSHAYRLGVGETGAIEAFAILRGLGDVHGNLYLKRVAVARPGQGLGTAFLSLVLDEAFGPMGAERFYLDCFADNARAQAAYLQARHEPRRRPAPGLPPRRRDARRPRHDGDPEARVGGAAAKYNVNMFVFSWNGPEARDLWVWTGLAAGWIFLESFVRNGRFQWVVRAVGGLSLLVPLPDRYGLTGGSCAPSEGLWITLVIATAV